MWSTTVTLNSMVSVGTMLGSRYLMKMKSDFNRKYKLNMETTNVTGSRVTMGDHMFLCSCGLGMFGPAVAYRG